ncbi:type II 3-dehydroquinate dehydratase [Thermospira aquatica]|uniref:3-dehydroquinate dehydratase n=1 Tax=Thermospira aquatica TaxID=2828656 RepID=A0AAX3BDJ7_9SPIR|nr:type II 3-dehydroquinate dehydratase [Thermospira aquatica]URA10393.1 type II 3-dehydroquinate dehydratase [Thermospira aquatica]
METLLLINGPNLNMLGIREPEKYGKTTLQAIVERLTQQASQEGYKLLAFQSNSEGDIVSFIHHNGLSARGALVNAGAYTHTSIALRDALLAVNLPFIEIHLSNIYAREAFRHHSFLADKALGVITGFGDYSYDLGLLALIHFLREKSHA